jgi:transcriptional regulator GlxA family with amidase domain
MKNLAILVPEGDNNLSSIVGAYKIITRANQYWQSLEKKPVFNIQLAGVSKEVKFHDSLFSVHPTHITKIKKPDLVIIPSLNHNFINSIKQNATIIHWIKNQHKRGCEIASICTGAFLLASTGLLDDKKCSTHWAAAEALKEMFPKIKVVEDKVITDESGIYTNGGAFSFLNLILYIIEKHFDRKTALYCSKVFQIDIERQSQSQFTIFSGLKNHEDDEVMKAQTILEKSLHTKIHIEDLASRVAVGRRTFDRRFRKATGTTPFEYLQKIKIEFAKRSLETNKKNVNQIMFDVGYSDIKAFRELFKKITGLSPLAYRAKFNKDLVAKK